MVILKAGGSAITWKSQPYTARPEVMELIAAQLHGIQRQVILAHGVGAYGHPLAKAYHIGKGFDGAAATRLGFLYTHYWVDELTQKFIKILLDHNVPAGHLHPSSLMITDQRRIVHFFDEPVRRYLDLGIMPVFHGDGPTDRSQGYCVLSADQTVVFLAKYFQARQLVFGIDVDGILDAGKTVPQLRFNELEGWRQRIADNQDASGGLPMKLKEIQALVNTGTQVQIINITQPGMLRAALLREKVGTIITD
ncbi:isopentenyl phosphate kinase family protein [candidate division KSB1 bacterium]|nr:isopentenyl phosphate kinase family protein [candidate division KSB1 bacterium]